MTVSYDSRGWIVYPNQSVERHKKIRVQGFGNKQHLDDFLNVQSFNTLSNCLSPGVGGGGRRG